MEAVMNIYRFTNSKGLMNHGVVLENLGDGANVLMDEFRTAPDRMLPPRYAYVSFADNKYVLAETKNEVLPLDHPVAWVEPEIPAIIKIMQAGKFPEWWKENQGRIIKKFIGGYKQQQ